MSKYWHAKTYGEYLRVELEGKPGYITIKAEDEGFVVDIWPDVGNIPEASTYSFYQDLRNAKMNDQPTKLERLALDGDLYAVQSLVARHNEAKELLELVLETLVYSTAFPNSDKVLDKIDAFLMEECKDE